MCVLHCVVTLFVLAEKRQAYFITTCVMILCWYKLVFVQFERTLELVLCTAVYPVDNMSGDSDHPCLLVTCPHNELAVKLFQHTIKNLNKLTADSHNPTEAGTIVDLLVKQGIEDQRVSVVCVLYAQF